MRTLNSIPWSLTLLAVGAGAWAHGENHPGPHGGVIRMPGAFHTEFVQDKGPEFRIYLLDMQFRNPVTEDSRVEGLVKRPGMEKTERQLSCQPRKTFFLCRVHGAPLEAGEEILLRSRRKGQEGGTVTYPFAARHQKLKS